MTILRDISFLYSMIHIVALFLLLFEPRYCWRTTLIVGFAGAGTLLIVNTLAMLCMGHRIIMSIAFFTCTIPTLLLFFVLSKYRDGRFFFLFCLTDTTCFWLLQITNFLDRLAGDTYVVMLVSRLIVFPAIELWFWKYLRRPYLELQKNLTKGWWLFAGTGATYYLLIMVTSVPVGSPMPDRISLMRLILVLILMPMTYLTILNSLWRQMQIYENNQQLERQRQKYDVIVERIEAERIYRHDMRHHLIVLEGLFRQGSSRDALQYIQELNQKLTDLTQASWCANPAVNAVLSAYLALAGEAGCTVKADLHIPDELPYGEMDLCIILANALENAVHACQDIRREERQAEEIKIEIRLELTANQRLTLTIHNSCPDPVRFASDGLPVSAPQEGHGLGLRSVRTIVRQYGGLFRVQWKEGLFCFQVVLFPPAGTAQRLPGPSGKGGD